MFANFSTYSVQPQQKQISPTAVSLPISVCLSFILMWQLPMLPGLFRLAPWLLGFAIGLVGTALFWPRRDGQMLWGMAILGQILGVLALCCFVMASLI